MRWGDVDDEVAERLRQRTALLRTRREMMRAYVDAEACRWAALCGYLGAAGVVSCGHCDACRRGRAARIRSESARRIRHVEFGVGTVLTTDDTTLTVLFETRGYRTLSKEIVDHNNLITDL